MRTDAAIRVSNVFSGASGALAARAARDQELFLHVAAHRQVFFSQTWVDYTSLQPGTLRLAPPPEHEAGWRQDYAAMQGEMFAGTPPPFDELLQSIKAFEAAFNAAASKRQLY